MSHKKEEESMNAHVLAVSVYHPETQGSYVSCKPLNFRSPISRP